MLEKRKFRIILTACFCMMLFASFSMVAQATNQTRAAAVDWVWNRGNEHWEVDYDGAYGCQCVDLILAYYDFLEGWHTSGNAIDYTSNTLPSGWSRVYSNPQPGDVIVFKRGAQMQSNPNRYANDTYGHIGIIWQVNANGTVSTVETNGDIDSNWNPIPRANFFTRITSGVACYIRPNFSGSGSNPTPQPQNEWTVGAVSTWESNAIVSVKYTLPSAVQFQWAGCNFFDANGKEVAKAGAATPIYSSYVNINYDINAETHTNYVLSPGTTYKYQFYVTYGSVDHFSPMYTFKTKDHSYTSSKKNPTCTSNGSITYRCSNCGYSYTETIKATGHSYSQTGSVEATCTSNGSKTYKCSKCGDSYTETIKATGHNWDNGVVTETATSSKNGVKTFTCTVCQATKTEVIPATGGIDDPGTSGEPQDPQIPQNPITPQQPITQQQSQRPSGFQLPGQGNTSAYLSTGTVFNYAGLGRLKVTGVGCVEFVKPSGNTKSIVIPDIIVLNGVTYKVTSIASV